MTTPTPKDVLFYVTQYDDHLNELVPEHWVFYPRDRGFDMPGTPPKEIKSQIHFRTLDVRKGHVPGIKRIETPSFLPGWDIWECCWTQSILEDMKITHTFEVEERYIDRWPDIWFISVTSLNAKAREAFENYCGDKCLFFPITIVSKSTGDVLPIERWIVYPRFWFNGDLSIDVETIPEPDTDIVFTSAQKRLAHMVQSNVQAAEYFTDLQFFSSARPGSGGGIDGPYYSADLYHKLKADGLSGLMPRAPKRSKHSTEEMREVMSHVFRV